MEGPQVVDVHCVKQKILKLDNVMSMFAEKKNQLDALTAEFANLKAVKLRVTLEKGALLKENKDLVTSNGRLLASAALNAELESNLIFQKGRVDEISAKYNQLEVDYKEIVSSSSLARNVELLSKNSELLARNGELVARNDKLNSSHVDLNTRICELNAKNDELIARNNKLSSSQVELNTRISELKARNDELIARNNRLSSSHVESNASIYKLKARNNELIAKNNKLNSSHELNTRISELNARNDELIARNDELNSSHIELNARICELNARNDELIVKNNALNSSHELNTKFSEENKRNNENNELNSSPIELNTRCSELNTKNENKELNLSPIKLNSRICEVNARNDELIANNELNSSPVKLNSSICEVNVRNDELIANNKLNSSPVKLNSRICDVNTRNDELIANKELNSNPVELNSRICELNARNDELIANNELISSPVKLNSNICEVNARNNELIVNNELNSSQADLNARICELNARNEELIALRGINEELLESESRKLEELRLEYNKLRVNFERCEAELKMAKRETSLVEKLQVENCNVGCHTNGDGAQIKTSVLHEALPKNEEFSPCGKESEDISESEIEMILLEMRVPQVIESIRRSEKGGCLKDTGIYSNNTQTTNSVQIESPKETQKEVVQIERSKGTQTYSNSTQTTKSNCAQMESPKESQIEVVRIERLKGTQSYSDDTQMECSKETQEVVRIESAKETQTYSNNTQTECLKERIECSKQTQTVCLNEMRASKETQTDCSKSSCSKATQIGCLKQRGSEHSKETQTNYLGSVKMTQTDYLGCEKEMQTEVFEKTSKITQTECQNLISKWECPKINDRLKHSKVCVYNKQTQAQKVKVTLRKAIETLKRSKVDVTIKNGRLINYANRKLGGGITSLERRIEKKILSKVIVYIDRNLNNAHVSNSLRHIFNMKRGANCTASAIEPALKTNEFDSGYTSDHELSSKENGFTSVLADNVGIFPRNEIEFDKNSLSRLEFSESFIENEVQISIPDETSLSDYDFYSEATEIDMLDYLNEKFCGEIPNLESSKSLEVQTEFSTHEIVSQEQQNPEISVLQKNDGRDAENPDNMHTQSSEALENVSIANLQVKEAQNVPKFACDVKTTYKGSIFDECNSPRQSEADLDESSTDTVFVYKCLTECTEIPKALIPLGNEEVENLPQEDPLENIANFQAKTPKLLNPLPKLQNSELNAKFVSYETQKLENIAKFQAKTPILLNPLPKLQNRELNAKIVSCKTPKLENIAKFQTKFPKLLNSLQKLENIENFEVKTPKLSNPLQKLEHNELNAKIETQKLENFENFEAKTSKLLQKLENVANFQAKTPKLLNPLLKLENTESNAKIVTHETQHLKLSNPSRDKHDDTQKINKKRKVTEDCSGRNTISTGSTIAEVTCKKVNLENCTITEATGKKVKLENCDSNLRLNLNEESKDDNLKRTFNLRNNECASYKTDKGEPCKSESSEKLEQAVKTPEFLSRVRSLEESILCSKPALNWHASRKMLIRIVRFKAEEVIIKNVVERFQPLDTHNLVDYIIRFIAMDTAEPETSTCPFEPVLTVTQKVMLTFLLRLEKTDRPNITENFLVECERRLLFSESDPFVVERITRVYAAACKMKRYKKRLRKLICDGMYFMGDLVLPLMFYILTTWIQVLRINNGELEGPLPKVLVQIVNTASCNLPQYCQSVLRNLLQVYYKYPKARYDENDLFQEFLEGFICNLDEKYEFALIILCKRSQSAWRKQKLSLIKELITITKDKVVVAGLARLLEKINTTAKEADNEISLFNTKEAAS